MVQPTGLRDPLAHARQPLHIGGGCKLSANRSGNEAVLAVAANHCCHVAVNNIDTQGRRHAALPVHHHPAPGDVRFRTPHRRKSILHRQSERRHIQASKQDPFTHQHPVAPAQPMSTKECTPLAASADGCLHVARHSCRTVIPAQAPFSRVSQADRVHTHCPSKPPLCCKAATRGLALGAVDQMLPLHVLHQGLSGRMGKALYGPRFFKRNGRSCPVQMVQNAQALLSTEPP